jgi:hypothetical protein
VKSTPPLFSSATDPFAEHLRNDTAAAALLRDGAQELEILTPAHLSALANHREIRNQLKTKELQKLMKIIDNSRCRLEALEAALHNVPEFKAFCATVLQTVYNVDSSKAAP